MGRFTTLLLATTALLTLAATPVSAQSVPVTPPATHSLSDGVIPLLPKYDWAAGAAGGAVLLTPGPARRELRVPSSPPSLPECRMRVMVPDTTPPDPMPRISGDTARAERMPIARPGCRLNERPQRPIGSLSPAP